MNFEKYIDDITQLIEENIDRLNNMDFPSNISYHISSVNSFDLTLEERKILNKIVDEIYGKKELTDKYPKNFIFDKLVSEVIIKSYDLTSTTEEIKQCLKNRFKHFVEILNEDFDEYTYFIPISGIFVEDKINFNSMTIYPFNDFKNEILPYFEYHANSEIELYNYLVAELDDLNSFCFVKITTKGTNETSKDIALNKVNELLSIFSLYKPHDINGFGIMGEVLPLDAHIVSYVLNSKDKLSRELSLSVRNRLFNLSENLEYMKGYYLDYLVDFLSKHEFNYVENILFNALGWYYQSVKTEFIYKSDIIEVTKNSKFFHEHYNYYKLGMKLINLISSVESIILFDKSESHEVRKERVNNIMNYNTDSNIDYYENYFRGLYKLRNDIVHNNENCNLLKFNIQTNTNLINRFIIKFVEMKFDFDDFDDKSLDSKKDLEELYGLK